MYIVSLIFSVLLTFILPIALSVYLARKNKGYLKPVLIGALTFFVFQILIRIPIIQLVLPNMEWYMKMTAAQPILNSVFLGATAGLFEEFGRYITMKLFLKNNQNNMDSIAFGVGHGGIEAILFVGINSLVMMFMSAQYAEPSMIFAGSIERLGAMTLHIAWSVMVMKSVREKKFVWVILAFLTHALVDIIAVLMSYYGLSVWLIEGALLIFAIIGVYYIRGEFRSEGN